MLIKKAGIRAVMFYVIQRSDVEVFAAATAIDRVYAETLKKAYDSGVEIFPVQVKVNPQEIILHKIIPFQV